MLSTKVHNVFQLDLVKIGGIILRLLLLDFSLYNCISNIDFHFGMDQRIWCKNDLSTINSYKTRKMLADRSLFSVPSESSGLRQPCRGWALWLLCLLLRDQFLALVSGGRTESKEWGSANGLRRQTLVIRAEDAWEEEKGGRRQEQRKSVHAYMVLFHGLLAKDWLDAHCSKRWWRQRSCPF